MPDNQDRFRERVEDAGVGLKTIELPPLPAAGTLVTNTAVDLSKLDTFAGSKVEITAVADKIKPQGAGDLQIDLDIRKVDEGVRKIQAREQGERVRALIDRAQKLIAEQKFREAMGVVDEALAVEPGAAAVQFLKGYCLFGLGNFREALQVLRKARRAASDPDTIVMILVLEALCDRAVTREIEAKLMEFVRAERYRDALDLANRELAASPGNVALTYHRCRILLLLRHTEQARSAAEGILPRLSGENRQLFLQLLAEILVAENQRFIDAARTALRRGDSAEAIRQLDQCYAAMSGNEQYEAIRAFAESRVPRGMFSSMFRRGRSLSEEMLQKTLLWLLSDELNSGMQALSREDFGGAAKAFEKAGRIDPRCRIICFLHAVAIFKAFNKSIEGDKKPDLDTAVAQLEQASALLNGCERDPAVGDQSRNLGQVVRSYLSQLRGVARQRAEAEAAAKPIKEVFDDFRDLMEGLKKNPISSARDVGKAESKLKDIRSRAHRLRRGAAGEAAEALDKLIEACDRNLAQADEARTQIKQAKSSRGPDLSQDVAQCAQLVIGLKQMIDKEGGYIDYDKKQQYRKLTSMIRGSITSARGVAYKAADRPVLDQLSRMLDDLERRL